MKALHGCETDAAFLDEIQTQALRVFLLAYSQSSIQLFLEISTPSNSRNLLHISTIHLLHTVKQKEGQPDRKPYLLPCWRNPYRNLKSENHQDYAQKNPLKIIFLYLKVY